MNANLKSIAVLKNINTFGADGALINSVLNFNNFKIYAFNRGALSSDNFGYKDKLELIEPPRDGGKLFSIFWRFYSQIKLVYVLLREKSVNSERDILVAGSAELAFILELVSFRSDKKYYLFSDITRYHKNKWTKNIVYFIEKYCVLHGWTPCVTSPGFYNGYLLPKIKCKSVYLVHNSVKSDLFAINSDFKCKSKTDKKLPADKYFKFEFVWCGLLRCRESFNIIFDAANRANGGVSACLHGNIHNLGYDCRKKISESEYILYKGEYLEENLDEIYRNADFTWCCDWSLGENSRLLIPNRLYQAIYFGVPVVCSKNTMLARVVEYYSIGFAIDPNVDSFIESVKNISNSVYSDWVFNIKKLKAFSSLENGGWDKILIGNFQVIDDNISNGDIFHGL